ncbi:hypothetical protein OROGR_009150 [Orobanche gracilis]
MEDELGQGSDVGVSEQRQSDGNLFNETLVENNMGGENQVEDTYKEGDDGGGGEIMVEIVGSDVFVDGVGGNKEGDFVGSAEIGNMDGHVLEEKEKEPETENFTESMDVSSEEGENKIEESESMSPEFRDEKIYVVVNENKAGDGDLGLLESKDGKDYVVTEATDVSSGGCEDQIGESELGLPESGDEKSYLGTEEAMDVLGEVGKNKTGESKLRLPELWDEQNDVVMESVDISGEGSDIKKAESELGGEKHSGEGGDNKMRESESLLPESSDEIFLGRWGEYKMEESGLGLPDTEYELNHVVTKTTCISNECGEGELQKGESGSGDEKNSVEVGGDKMGGIESALPESRNENTMGEGAENKMGSRDLGLPQSGTEKNPVITKETDGSCSESVKIEVGVSSVQGEEAILKMKLLIEYSDSISSHDAAKDWHDGENAVSEVPLDPNGDGQISSVKTEEANQMVITDAKTVKDEAADEKGGITERDEILPLSDGVLNQIMPSAVVNNPNWEGPENIRVVGEVDLVSVIARREILDTDTLEDSVSKASVIHASTDEDSNEEDEFVDDREGFLAENKDLVVKPDALVSDVHNESEACVNDSQGAYFESGQENEREEAMCEEFDVVLDSKDGGSDINRGDLETNMIPENDVASNEPTVLANGCDNDIANEDKSLDVDRRSDTKENLSARPEVVDGGGLSENVEKTVSEECREKFEIQNVVKCGLPQIEEQVVVTETLDHEISILPEITEKSESPSESNNVSLFDVGEIDQEKSKSGGEEIESCINCQDAMEIDIEPSPEADKSNFSKEDIVRISASPLKMNQPGYLLPPEIDGRFAISDLVWGKIRSHPWWTGQIFYPSDASEKAVKYFKNDSDLAAYFGDWMFAWNDPSLVKPIRSHFSQIEKQSNSKGFQDAVVSALEEVSRRVELSLACSCIPKDKYATFEPQIVENIGISEESSKRYAFDHSTRASFLEPHKLLEYVRELAPRAYFAPDRLDLAIVRAQLWAFYHFKGYRPPAVFALPGKLLELDPEKINSEEIIASHNRTHAPKDSPESEKEKSLTEIMAVGEYDINEDESFGKKRKAHDPLKDGYDERVSIYASKVSNLTSQTHIKPSFKIGECIRRVAIQLTGSSSSGKDEIVIDERPEGQSMVLSVESFPVSEMLSQLEVVAHEPKKRHNFINVIHNFFIGFRSWITLNRRVRKKRAEQTTPGPPSAEYEFDDVSDSYWTDRIVHNYSEEQVLSNRVNGLGNSQLVPFGVEKTVKTCRRPNSRKRFSDQTTPDGLDERVKRRKQESLPAELILKFAERSCIPSEINLNKMFRRFGPLMESETEVDHESGCAKVIFKRGGDAEVARDSSEKFKIFEPVLVSYQVGYDPLISVKVLPLPITSSPRRCEFDAIALE